MSVDFDLWQILEISFLFLVSQWCCHFVERSFQKGCVMGSEIDMIFIIMYIYCQYYLSLRLFIIKMYLLLT